MAQVRLSQFRYRSKIGKIGPRAHRDIIFMRLEDERAANKIQVLRQLLESYADRFEDQFVVVSETQVRFGKTRT